MKIRLGICAGQTSDPYLGPSGEDRPLGPLRAAAKHGHSGAAIVTLHNVREVGAMEYALWLLGCAAFAMLVTLAWAVARSVLDRVVARIWSRGVTDERADQRDHAGRRTR